MKPFVILILLFIVFISPNTAQNVGQVGDSVVNYQDINGLKHGLWTKKYKNGKTAYIAHFKNDKLIGDYQRFYTSGKVSLQVQYDENEAGPAQLFYDDGVLSAEGRYIHKNVKDGLWKFYGVDGKMVVEIHYKNGVLDGKELKYWRNGKVMEEKNWVNGQQEGLWAQYFETGQDRLKTKMVHNKRHGLYYTYYPNGKYYVKGQYKDNYRVGAWTYYTEEGEVRRATTYKMGVAADQDEIDEKTTREIEEWEKMKDVIPDPNIDNMFKYDKTYQPLSK